MTSSWEHIFRRRMLQFNRERPPRQDEVAISIKVSVVFGCFHREHSPHAFEILDRYFLSVRPEDRVFALREHESGPEILVYLALTTAGVALAKSIVDLVTTIIKARSESVKKGDSPCEPVELIVRRVCKDGEFREEKLLRFSHRDHVDKKAIDQKLHEVIGKLIGNDESASG